MAKQKKIVIEDVPQGAPDWMVTFSDCMTLLLTFFVLLLSFATFNEETLPELGTQFNSEFQSAGFHTEIFMDSPFKRQQIKTTDQVTEGVKDPSLDRSDVNKFKNKPQSIDFRDLKVFSIESKEFFYGSGSSLSKKGQDLLASFAVILRERPGRVVISENGPGNNASYGLDRACAIVDYLTSLIGVEKDSFSITSSSMMRKGSKGERMVEITLLEQNVYE